MDRTRINDYRRRSSATAARERVLEPEMFGIDRLTDGVSVERDERSQTEQARSGLLEWVRREVVAAWAACGMFEFVALGYLAISSVLILLFAENLAHPLRLLGTRAFVVAAILALCRVESRVVRPERFSGEALRSEETSLAGQSDASAIADLRPSLAERFWHFWRHWYPHLFFLFCFEELGRLVHLIQPGWQDAKLIAFDHWFTGVHPSIWLEQFATPGRNEFFQFVYITYFTYLLVVGGTLYYRRDWRGYWSVMTYSAVGYAIGYMIAISFPIQSPWFSMAGSWHGPLQGGAATALINFIEHYGRVRGAAFPSEHVAGAVAATWGAWRHRRWLFWVMLPLVACMCASTIWGRYHYVADVFAGMVTGTLGYIIGSRLMKRQGSIPAADVS
jgi:membrane-associated phospholipid phosphatase